MILNNLAALNSQQANHDIALDLYAQARRIVRRGYGASHPTTRACEENQRRMNERQRG